MKNYIKKTTKYIVGCWSSVVSRQSAFTLVELIVVVAIAAVVSVGGFAILYKYRASQNLKLALNEIIAVARNTQQMSVTQKDGKQWGIRFSNSTSSGYTFKTWSGSSFASSTPNQTYKLRSGVSFGNPALGRDIDIVFSPITGIVSQNQFITLLAGSAGSTVGDILVNTLGKATARKEEGLVGYWHFDEGTSTIAYDVSGYGNNGTLAYGPTWQSEADCKAGKCLSFDGSDDYISVGTDKLKYQDNFSVSAVFKFSSLPTNGGICSARHPIIYNHDYGYNLLISSVGKVSWNIYNTSSASKTVNSASSIIGSGYVHAVGTKSGTTISLYVNGQFQGQDTLTTNAVYYTANPFVIGGYAVCGGQRFYATGFIDEVRVYNRVLSATEVLQMYNDLR